MVSLVFDTCDRLVHFQIVEHAQFLVGAQLGHYLSRDAPDGETGKVSLVGELRLEEKHQFSVQHSAARIKLFSLVLHTLVLAFSPSTQTSTVSLSAQSSGR